jgi:hypothetical protein
MKSTLIKLVTDLARLTWSFVAINDSRQARFGQSLEIRNSQSYIQRTTQGNDLFSGIAYLILAGSLFVSLVEFLAAVP